MRGLAFLLLAVSLPLWAGPDALAQRPFASLAPFYEEETARRVFFDGFAAQADMTYRGIEPLGASDDLPGSPLALSLRFDHALARQLDVGAVFDLSGGLDGAGQTTPLRLSWLVAKPYWRYGHTDYAVRLAVDPFTEGGFGFRQTDLAFLATSDLSPRLSSDFALGVRRAHVGFERLSFDDDPLLVIVADMAASSTPSITRSRAVGTELHGMWGHRLWLDPGGSHAFVTLSGEVMQYELIEMRPLDAAEARGDGSEAEPVRGQTVRGGVGHLRAGVEFSRPSFRVAPYASLPLARYAETDEASRSWGPRIDHARFGLRLMLR